MLGNHMSFEVVSDIGQFLALSLSHNDEYVTVVDNVELWVHPQVMSPLYSYSSRFLMRHWDVRKDMRVLDMGTGCGILAVFAARAGAKSVVACDINAHAVSVAQKNITNHKLHNVEVRQSNLFAQVPLQQFDRIIFNAPFWSKAVDNEVPLTYACFDEHYDVLKNFLEQSVMYLAKNGRILLCYSNQSNLEIIRAIIEYSDFNIVDTVEETHGHTRILYFLERIN